MKTVRLITCDNIIDAYFIKGKLKNEGIICFLTNEISTNLKPGNTMSGVGIQIFINEKDAYRALELLKNKSANDNISRSCPYCGSNNIELRSEKNKLINLFHLFISLLIVSPFGYLKHKFYCKDCNKVI